MLQPRPCENRFRILATASCLVSLLVGPARVDAQSSNLSICDDLAAAISTVSESKWFEEREAGSEPRAVTGEELSKLSSLNKRIRTIITEADDPTIQEMDFDGNGTREQILRSSELCATYWLLRVEANGQTTILEELQSDDCLEPVHYVETSERVLAVIPRKAVGVKLPIYDIYRFQSERLDPVCRISAIDASAEAFNTCSSPVCERVAESVTHLIRNGGHLAPGNPLPRPLPILWDMLHKKYVFGTRGRLADFDNDGGTDLLVQTEIEGSAYTQGFFRLLEGEWVNVDVANSFEVRGQFVGAGFNRMIVGDESVEILFHDGRAYWVAVELDRSSSVRNLYELAIAEPHAGVLSTIGEVSARFTSRTTRVEMFAPQAP